jgi:aspartate/methionine/tyrosine aminotransferase
MAIERFEMERYQSRYWHLVDYDLSEAGVTPLTIAELLGADAAGFVDTPLGYPLSEGSHESRSAIAQWYPEATPDHVTMMNGGSEANLLTVWSLLEPGDRLAFMVPNYCQALGLGPMFADAVDTFRLSRQGDRWGLDLESLDRAVGPRTKVVMVCNPNNPTGTVLTEAEMQAVIDVAARADAWIVADEIYRGAEVDTDVASPTFWGRSDKVVVTSGLSKAFGMPGLRVGWAVAPTDVIARIWDRHDYTTLTPGAVSDRLTAVGMEPSRREEIFARTRGIIRSNLPDLESWLSEQPMLRYVRPVAGAIAFVEVDVSVPTREVVERIRRERSVLLVPGEMFGIDNGIRFGFGYDIQHTLKGLSLAGETLASLA